MNWEEVLTKFKESSTIINLTGEKFSRKIVEVSEIIINAYKNGNKVLLAGNGGSAADAQHISGELVNKFYKDRRALSALALSTDTSVLTSWANDVSYDFVFARQIEAHGKPGDIFIPITTSGNSTNLVRATEKAKERGIICIGLLGRDGGKLKELCDYDITIPYSDTPRIQEAQKVVYHIICEIVERAFAG